MMTRVDEVEDDVLHVSHLRTQKVGGVEELEVMVLPSGEIVPAMRG
jgi:hypothetical protein